MVTSCGVLSVDIYIMQERRYTIIRSRILSTMVFKDGHSHVIAMTDLYKHLLLHTVPPSRLRAGEENTGAPVAKDQSLAPVAALTA